MISEIYFHYINYRGEHSDRRVRPLSMRFGSSEYHDQPQWLMLAVDLAKNERREFAMRDMSAIQPRDGISLVAVAQEAQPPYQSGYRDGYETAREDNKHREPDLVALYAFIKAYGSQDSFTEGLDRAVKLARDAVAIYDFKKSEAAAVSSTRGNTP